MSRHYQVGARLTTSEFKVLQDWLARQQPEDPEVRLSISDAIRQAIRDMVAAEQKREGDRQRRVEQASKAKKAGQTHAQSGG
jgi:hypothetical protein